MSLVKKPTMTPQKMVANQANAHLSQGPNTPEGRERIREANTRHGFYSLAADEALRALGEDPDDLKALVQDVIDTWHPVNGFETRLVVRLARALWRLERDDHWHDSVAVRQLRQLDENVERLIREAQAQFRKKQAALKRMVEAAKKEEFATSLDQFSDFADVFGEEPKDRPWEIYVLLNRLLKPGTPVRGAVPEGYKGPEAEPDYPIAEDHHRTPVRRELRERLEAEMEVLKVALGQQIEELRQEGSDPYLRDTLKAPTHPQAELMLRAENSSFRKVERLTTLLLHIRQRGASAYTPHTKNEGISHDVDENKGQGKAAAGISHDIDENTEVNV